MAVEDISAQIDDIKKRYNSAEIQRLRAEAAKAEAESKLAALTEQLENTYGVNSVQEAVELLKAKKERLDELLRQAEKDLENA